MAFTVLPPIAGQTPPVETAPPIPAPTSAADLAQGLPPPQYASVAPSVPTLPPVAAGPAPVMTPAPAPQQPQTLPPYQPAPAPIPQPLPVDLSIQRAAQLPQDQPAPEVAPPEPAPVILPPPSVPELPVSSAPDLAPWRKPAATDVDFSSRDNFVRSLLPSAQAVEARTGIPADVLLAIPLNEQGPRPAPGNNYYGIKGEGTGPVATWEDYGNGPVQTQASFRSYATPQDSMQDFANFLRDNPRYRPALERLHATGDGAQFVRDIKAAGYATDPAWPQKILSIANEVRSITGGRTGTQFRPLSATGSPPAPATPPPPPAGPPEEPQTRSIQSGFTFDQQQKEIEQGLASTRAWIQARLDSGLMTLPEANAALRRAQEVAQQRWATIPNARLGGHDLSLEGVEMPQGGRLGGHPEDLAGPGGVPQSAFTPQYPNTDPFAIENLTGQAAEAGLTPEQAMGEVKRGWSPLNPAPTISGALGDTAARMPLPNALNGQPNTLGGVLGEAKAYFTDPVAGLFAVASRAAGAAESGDAAEFQRQMDALYAGIQSSGLTPSQFFGKMATEQPTIGGQVIQTLADPGQLLLMATTGAIAPVLEGARFIAGRSANELAGLGYRLRGLTTEQEAARGAAATREAYAADVAATEARNAPRLPGAIAPPEQRVPPLESILRETGGGLTPEEAGFNAEPQRYEPGRGVVPERQPLAMRGAGAEEGAPKPMAQLSEDYVNSHAAYLRDPSEENRQASVEAARAVYFADLLGDNSAGAADARLQMLSQQAQRLAQRTGATSQTPRPPESAPATGPEMLQALQDQGRAQVIGVGTAKPTPPRAEVPGATHVGQNAIGHDLYEDANGVRLSIGPKGERHGEMTRTAIIPGYGAGKTVPATEGHEEEFRTPAELGPERTQYFRDREAYVQANYDAERTRYMAEMLRGRNAEVEGAQRRLAGKLGPIVRKREQASLDAAQREIGLLEKGQFPRPSIADQDIRRNLEYKYEDFRRAENVKRFPLGSRVLYDGKEYEVAHVSGSRAELALPQSGGMRPLGGPVPLSELTPAAEGGANAGQAGLGAAERAGTEGAGALGAEEPAPAGVQQNVPGGAGDLRQAGGGGNTPSGAGVAGNDQRSAAAGVAGGNQNGDAGAGTGLALGASDPAHSLVSNAPAAHGTDLVLRPGDAIGHDASPTVKFDANLEAIRLVKQLQAENRLATPEEQQVIARFSGWGDSRFGAAFPAKGYDSSAFHPGDVVEYQGRQFTVWYGTGNGAVRLEGVENPAEKPIVNMSELQHETAKRNMVTRGDALRQLVTKDEYEHIEDSRQNAFFTTPDIIATMWAGLRQLGLDGLSRPRVLEPSAGSGRFLAYQPKDLAAKSDRHAVEKDTLTGAMLRALFPNTDVYVTGFEEAPIGPESVDVAISNIPFGTIKMYDPSYTGSLSMFLSSIHNYFFAKGLDKLRPGGVIAYITSHGTMDAPSSRDIRAALASRADLLAAVRLPRGAFPDTDVVTDIIFLRKRLPEDAPGDAAWVDTEQVQMPAEKQYKGAMANLPVNRYFVEHPEMVMGTHSGSGTMRGSRDAEYTLDPIEGQDVAGEVARRLGSKLPRGVLKEAPVAAPVRSQPAKTPKSGRSGSYVLDTSGKLMLNQGGVLRDAGLSPESAARVQGMMAISDAAHEVYNLQLREADKADITAAQAKLNKLYDAFTQKYGPLNNRANADLMKVDQDGPFLRALEKLPDDPKALLELRKQQTLTAAQAASMKMGLFSGITVRGLGEPRPTTANDALLVSLNETGGLNFQRMGELLGRTPLDVQTELAAAGRIYKNPEGSWETAEQYLSGNVRAKLKAAITANEASPTRAYRANVDALKDVQPEEKTPGQIKVSFAPSWMPASDMNDFIAELLGHPDGAGRDFYKYVPALGKWVEGADKISPDRSKNEVQWGAPRMSATSIIDHLMNSSTIKITRGDPPTVDEEATAGARAQAKAILQAFGEWVWSDGDRSERLANRYNDLLNTQHAIEHDGSHLTFPGMMESWAASMRPHQKSAVWRALQDGTVGLFHDVGFGKSLVLAATGMELRRMGLSRKNLYVVPKNTHENFLGEFRKAYPYANILFPSPEDFTGENVGAFMSRMATGDWDAIILSMEQYAKIPIRPETAIAFIQQEIDDYRSALVGEVTAQPAAPQQGYQRGRGGRAPADAAARFDALEQDASRGTPAQKALAAKLNNLRVRLRTLQAKLAAKTAATLYFEDLGLDYLFVDEFHNYKSLQFATSRDRVKGIPNSESERARDMFQKIRILQRQNGGRGIIVATGTPLTNTIAEMYTMMRYLQYPQLEQLGIQHFDAWASTFGLVTNDNELSPMGVLRPTERFAKFLNLPELSQFWQQVADIRVRKEVPEMTKFDPQVKRETLIATPDEAQLAAFQDIIRRAEAIKGIRPAKGEDNILSLMTEGDKVALGLGMPENSTGKLAMAAREVFQTWKEERADKGTQLVFLNLGAPRASDKIDVAPPTDGLSEDEATGDDEQKLLNSAYALLKESLIKKGIPANEIAFMQEAKTAAKKKQLLADVNAGRVRVLIGSNKNMGQGLNVQERLAREHHIDISWRPDEYEQAEGRVIRQGNLVYGPKVGKNGEITDPGRGVRISRYVLERSFNHYKLQSVEKKLVGFSNVKARAVTVREVEDISPEAMDVSQMKAAATGNPEQMRLSELEIERQGLALEEASHNRSMRDAAYQTRRIPEDIKDLKESLKHAQADEKLAAAPGSFSFKVGTQTFSERPEAAKALVAAIEALKTAPDETAELGKFKGFTVQSTYSPKRQVGGYTWDAYYLVNLVNPAHGKRVGGFRLAEDEVTIGVMTRIQNAVAELLKAPARIEATVAQKEKDLAGYREQAGREFRGRNRLGAIDQEIGRLTRRLGSGPARPEDETPIAIPEYGAAAAPAGEPTPAPMAQEKTPSEEREPQPAAAPLSEAEVAALNGEDAGASTDERAALLQRVDDEQAQRAAQESQQAPAETLQPQAETLQPPAPAAEPPQPQGLTQEAQDLLDQVDKGEKPASVGRRRLRRAAQESGVAVPPEASPDEIVAALQAKEQEVEAGEGEEEPFDSMPETEELDPAVEELKRQYREDANRVVERHPRPAEPAASGGGGAQQPPQQPPTTFAAPEPQGEPIPLGPQGSTVPPAEPPAAAPPPRPRRTLTGGKKPIERGHARTVRETDDISDALRAALTDPAITYPERRNTEALYEQAKARIEAEGLDAVIESILATPYDRLTDRQVAAGQIAERMLDTQGTPEAIMRAQRVVEHLATGLTEAGRTVQAASLFRRLTPEGWRLRATQDVQRAKEAVGERRVKGRMLNETTRLIHEQGAQQTKDSERKEQTAKSDAADLEEQAKNTEAGKPLQETAASKSNRSKVITAFRKLASEGRAPGRLAGQEDPVDRMNRLAQESGWLWPHSIADAFVAEVEDASTLPKHERPVRIQQIVDEVVSTWLPELEQRAADYREAEANRKMMQDLTDWAANQGRNPTVPFLTTGEKVIVGEIRKAMNAVGFVLAEDRRAAYSNALWAVRGMDPGPLQIEAMRDLVRTMGDELLPMLYAEREAQKTAAALLRQRAADQAALATWERQQRAQIPDLVRDALKKSKDLIHNGEVTLTSQVVQEILRLGDVARTLPPGSPEQWLATQQIAAYVRQFVPPSRMEQALEGFNGLPRTMIFMMNMAAPAIHGLPYLARHPLATPGLYAAGLKALADPTLAADLEARMFTHPLAARAQAARLGIAPRTSQKLLPNRDRMGTVGSAGTLVRRVALAGGWGDAYLTQVNKLRMDNFILNVHAAERAYGRPLTPQEDAEIARPINLWSLYGRLPRAASRLAADLMFAPRVITALAEIPVMATQSLASLIPGARLANKVVPGLMMTSRIAARQAAAQLAAFVALGLATIGGAIYLGFKVEGDPLKSNFGEIQLPNGVKVNPFHRFTAVGTLLARLWAGKLHSSTGSSVPVTQGESLFLFARTRTAPGANLIASLLTHKDYAGRPIFDKVQTGTLLDTLEKKTGLPFRETLAGAGGVVNAIAEEFVPAFLQDFYEEMDQHGRDGGALAESVALTFLGISQRNFDNTRDVQDEASLRLYGQHYPDLNGGKGPDKIQRDAIAGSPEVTGYQATQADTYTDPERAYTLAQDSGKLWSDGKAALEEKFAAALPVLSGRDLHAAIVGLKHDRSVLANGTLENATVQAVREGKNKLDAPPLDLLGEEYWSAPMPVKADGVTPDFAAFDANRRAILDKAPALGVDPDLITGTGAGTYRGVQYSDPKVQAAVTHDDELQTVARQYYDARDAFAAKIPGLQPMLDKVQEYEKSGTAFGVYMAQQYHNSEQYKLYTAFEADFKGRHPDVNKAGIELGYWQPSLKIAATAPPPGSFAPTPVPVAPWRPQQPAATPTPSLPNLTPWRNTPVPAGVR